MRKFFKRLSKADVSVFWMSVWRLDFSTHRSAIAIDYVAKVGPMRVVVLTDVENPLDGEA